MTYLLDTNILSELRKGARCDGRVARWSDATAPERLYTSVLVLGEIRRGVERARRSDSGKAAVLGRWLDAVRVAFAGRILPVDDAVAEDWGRMTGSGASIPIIDGLLAATAKVHGLTLVTRNVTDVERTGAAVLNPFIGEP